MAWVVDHERCGVGWAVAGDKVMCPICEVVRFPMGACVSLRIGVGQWNECGVMLAAFIQIAVDNLYGEIACVIILRVPGALSPTVLWEALV